MNEPTVTLELDLDRIVDVRPDDGPHIFPGWSTVYIVRNWPDGQGTTIDVARIKGHDLVVSAAKG